MLALYIPRRSLVHSVPTTLKLTICLIGSAAITFLGSPGPLAIVLMGIVALYALSRLPLTAVAAALRPLFLVGGIIFLLQLALSGWPQATATALRITALVLLASLVTLTTPLSDMIEVLTKAVSPVAHLGLSPAKFGLAIALAIRFIPGLTNDWHEMQHARMARGASRASILVIGPLILKILCMTNALGDAIAARGFEGRK